MTLLLVGCFALRPVPPAPDLALVPNAATHASSAFDRSLPNEIASEWGRRGAFILVHPWLNGRDVGWFILDTGASGSTISADAAAAAGLAAIGKTVIAGPTTAAASPIESTVYRCDALRLGPLTLQGLSMTGLDVEHASGTFGRPIAGILGQNVFTSAIVELDGPARAVRLHAVDDVHPLDGATIVPIEMRRGLPHVRASFSQVRDALFLLDTGANVGVHVAAEAVERDALQEARGITIDGGQELLTFGSSERVDAGTIESFRIGTLECGPLRATFGRPRGTERRRDTGVDGRIGMGVLVRHVVVFDVPNGRVALGPAALVP
ncbi:MAG: retropepsin-like domain-containing protein [Phycisphaerae bacterium]|nr:retropepsin-like domain-containing protein [Phycisphaerae bacterium]